MGELRSGPGWPGAGFAARGRRGRGRRASLIERRDPKLYAKLENQIQTIVWNWPDQTLSGLENVQDTLMQAEKKLASKRGPSWGDLPLFRASAPRDLDPGGELESELLTLQQEVEDVIREAQEMIDDDIAYDNPRGTSGRGSDEFTERMEELVGELEGSLTGSGW
tara:strand:+ start:137 stop:631 length:495 start_codon:yes stop_codon:yes gene_type:complete